MARWKRVSRSRKSKTGNARGQGGHEQQEHSQYSARMAGTNPQYFSEHNTMCHENNEFGFTLADIARETSLHDHSQWSERSNLRNKPVHFVSHVSRKLLKSNSSDESDVKFPNIMTASCADQPEVHTNGRFIPQEVPALVHTTSNGDKPVHTDILLPSTEPIIDQNTCSDELFIVDTVGTKIMRKNRQQLIVEIPERHSSPDSSSDDEIILFRGRKSHGKATFSAGFLHETRLPTATLIQSQHLADATCPLPETSRPKTRKEKKTRPVNGEQGRVPFQNEDVLLDYICNIRESGELEDIYGQHRHIRHDLAESDEDICLRSSQSGDETHGGLHVGDQDDCQHLSRNGSISDVRHTNNYKADENNDLSVKQGTLATVAKSAIGPSPAVDPSVCINVKERHDLSQEQVDFDFMNRDRPSVQRVKGGKAARAKYITLNDRDSDLERQLQVAWKNDRQRKKERKQQREELRALGLLQKKITSDDLRLKYPFGMTIMEVADELKLFLQQEKETIIFPPMDLHARKTVHELANTFNIKSKSVGSAEQRRPSLHRTIRTLRYSETMFWRAVGPIHRKYLPRADIKGKSRSSSKKQSTSGASMTATIYQEGEIVGATAPELGIGNRGRAMLEKMGWSRGTALGAEDNKGILQPVSLVMKRSKAGLG